MRKVNVVLFAVFLIAFAACKSTSKLSESEIKPLLLSTETMEQLITMEETTSIISHLASDELSGRKPGTDGFRKAGEYAETFMSGNSISPLEDSYKDEFVSEKGVDTYNVVGVIKSEKPSTEYVMICAHLDHLGKKVGIDSVYNGANDNASGSTAVLQVAKALSLFSFEQNIIVSLFSAEETGLEGSKHLAVKLKSQGINLTHVFNFEMIGKTLSSGKNEVYITGFKKSNLAEKMNEVLGFEFVKFLPMAVRYQLFSRSDNFPFYAEYKIPSHTISTFDFENYEHYHKESDEVQLLDLENMNVVIRSSALAIAKVLLDNEVALTEEPNSEK